MLSNCHKSMDRNLLIRYLRCETSTSDEAMILDWLDKSEENRRELDRLSEVFNMAVLHSPVSQKKESKIHSAKSLWQYAAIAAILVAIAFGGAYHSARNRIEDYGTRLLAMRAPAGQRIDFTLHDGTRVWLNGGSSLVYPVAFTDNRRMVWVVGEARFDVSQDAAGHSFIVNTPNGNIEVLGTKFDIESDSAKGIFRTSLLRGKVAVHGNSGHSIELAPGEQASFENGTFVKRKIENPDDFSWTENIIVLNSDSFWHLMAKIERAYDIKAELLAQKTPQIRYRGKVGIEEGLEHTMEILLTDTGMDFEIDRETRTVFIR